MILGKSRTSRGQLLTAPERMKRLDQSENDAQSWMYLVATEKLGQRVSFSGQDAQGVNHQRQTLNRLQMFLHMRVTLG